MKLTKIEINAFIFAVLILVASSAFAGKGNESERGNSANAPGAEHRAQPAIPNPGKGRATPAVPAHKQDRSGPVLSDVNVTAITSSSAVITWISDEPSTSAVAYEPTDIPGYAFTIDDTNLVLSHAITLSGLFSDQPYYYYVASVDASGNRTELPPSVFETLEELPPPPPEGDAFGPLITAFSVSPTSVEAGEPVTITMMADDPNGLEDAEVVIRYPSGQFTFRPHCNFNGAATDTCVISEPIDLVVSPTEFGNYNITSVSISDVGGDVAIYYADGTVANGREATHVLAFPSILVSETATEVPPSTKFLLGDRVVTTDTVNVRQAPSLSATSLGLQGGGSQGTVIGGPVNAVGFDWWQIDYDFAPDGWSVENYLELVP